MAPKRKSDAMSTHQTTLTMGVPPIAVLAPAKEDPNTPNEDAEPASKKARVGTASSSKAQPAPKIKEKKGEKKVLHWTEVTLEGEEEGDVTVYDDCNEVRRKIRLLLSTPGFKITHWLKEIGGVNSNSYNRFMKLSGPAGGSDNSTYQAAYVYFEKVRIAEGKKKTTKRIRNEAEWGGGMVGRRSRGWVLTGK